MRDCVAQCDHYNDDGLGVNHFVAKYLSDCIYTNREMASFIVGMSSLGFWLLCQAPQFIKNIQRKSADALSCWFLLEWVGGDVTNLVGALLSGQQKTQIFTAVLFLIMDICLLSQFFYYRRLNAKKKKAPTNDEDALLRSPAPGSVNPDLAARLLVVAAIPAGAEAFRVLMSDDSCAPTVTEERRLIGWSLGWVSAVIYLNSRIPQIVKNYRRKYTSGLSAMMFGCAVLGNITYALGAIIRFQTWNEYWRAMPWLVGSLGTVSLDFIIISQVKRYGKVRPSALQREDTPGQPTNPSIVTNLFRPKAFSALNDPVKKVGNVQPVYLYPSTRSMGNVLIEESPSNSDTEASTSGQGKE